MESDLLSTKKQLETTLASVDGDKKYFEEQLSIMNDRLKKKEEEIYQLKDLLVKKDEEVIRATGEIKGSQIVLENLKTKLKEARNIIQEQNEISLKDQILKLSKENDYLRHRLEGLAEVEEEFIILKSKLEKEISVNSNLNTKLRKSESEMEVLCEELTTFRDQNEILQKDLDQCKERLNHYVKLSEAINEELSIIKEKSRAPRKSDNEIENGLTKSSSEVTKLQDELTKLSSINKKLEFDYNELNKELTLLKVQKTENYIGVQHKNLKLLEQEIAKLNNVIEALNKNHSKEIINYNREISVLKQNLADFKSLETDTFEALKKEIDEKHDLQIKLNSSIKELNTQKTFTQNVEKKCGELQNKIDSKITKSLNLSFSEINLCDFPSLEQTKSGRLYSIILFNTI